MEATLLFQFVEVPGTLVENVVALAVEDTDVPFTAIAQVPSPT